MAITANALINSVPYASDFGPPNLQLYTHLPMAVVALEEMGARADRIESWAGGYARANELQLASPEELAARKIWYERIIAEGRDAVLRAALPKLVEGIGAAAFHAAIRAGYALERNNDIELAAALESWEREFLNLPAPVKTRSVSLEKALSVLADSEIRTESRGLIATRMQTAANDSRFAMIAQNVPRSTDINSLAVAAAVAFAESGDFTALHVMTGTHAMRVLTKYIPDPESAMPAFWRAYAAAALVAGTVPSLAPAKLESLRAEAPAGWEALLATAIAHDDDHVIKSTYTAWRLDRAIRNPIFRTAARRYINQETYQ